MLKGSKAYNLVTMTSAAAAADVLLHDAGDDDYDDPSLALALTVEETSFVAPAASAIARTSSNSTTAAAAAGETMLSVDGHHPILLSSLDLLYLHSPPHRRLLFYTAPPPSPPGEVDSGVDHDYSNWQRQQARIVDRLKSSLAKALRHFYPLAGKLKLIRDRDGAAAGDDGQKKRSDYSYSYAIATECRRRGVPFVVCAASGPLRPFALTGFCPRPFFYQLAPRLHSWRNPPVQSAAPPLLSIQVTKFACGGIAVGFANQSCVADGHSMWRFMNWWAQLSRRGHQTMQMDDDEGDLQLQPPCHNRRVFTVNDAVVDTRQQHHSSEVAQTNTEDCRQEPLVERLFRYNDAAIAALVKRAGMHPRMLREFNTYEVVCAHLWKQATRAKWRYILDVDGSSADTAAVSEERVCVHVMGDMRFRVVPPLPASFFGNGAMTAVASATRQDIAEEPLSSTAFRIHEACKACNEGNLWAKLRTVSSGLAMQEDEVAENVDITEKRRSCSVATTSSMRIVGSHKYDVYGVDFGWGRPAAVRTAWDAEMDVNGRVVLFPESGGGGGIEACLTLPLQAMHRLHRDHLHFLAA